jgi:predicted acetyltransferase
MLLESSDSNIFERIGALGRLIPEEEQRRHPRGGAANLDHYLYGSPRQYARWSFDEKATAMAIDIIEATAAHRDVLSRLMELYQYDFTEFTEEDVGEDGSFGYRYLDATLTEPGRYAHLVRIDGRWAGFAIVREDVEFLDGRTGIDMAEFFVLRKYRRQGAGERLASAMFDRYRGAWQVRVIGPNERARSFWRDVVHRYTDAFVQEHEFPDERWGRRWVYYFENSVR